MERNGVIKKGSGEMEGSECNKGEIEERRSPVKM